MYRAIALKELREVAPIAILALVAYLACIDGLTGGTLFAWMPFVPRGLVSIPFTGKEPFYFAFISIAMTIALGYRQTLGEEYRGTYLYLLHRPMQRSQIFACKLATGAAVYLVGSFIPIALYLFWAATPGNHPSPFYWSMTFSTWQAWLALLLLYLGAFLSGLKPGRWIGARLLPLAGAGLLVGFVLSLPWWPLGLLFLLLALALCVANVQYVAARRDYA